MPLTLTHFSFAALITNALVTIGVKPGRLGRETGPNMGIGSACSKLTCVKRNVN
uniref:Uncharacterized protein n=1 Tax=Candidatus Kentrum sp. LPFa TaxID=2126335 RepID=A0A450X6G3_9GAMM|nr:MAG: hypothetical protein BECKLPF1236A_GA0070988_104443 [Candidatus Kentron sp. LPFa]VFK35873.1 MAG: hypothetical protein BECKLPF1236C_GA0070990_104392 [Candidatus Kentron sp. LPFa]